MKLFRNLLIAAAAINSFGSIAGIINFNWNQSQHPGSFYHYYLDEETGNLNYERKQISMAPTAISLDTNKELGANTINYDADGDDYRLISFDTQHRFTDSFSSFTTFCSYSYSSASECDLSTAANVASYQNIYFRSYPNNVQYFTLSFNSTFRLDEKTVTNGNKQTIYYRDYTRYFSIGRFFYEDPPLWLINQEVPAKYNDIMQFLNQPHTVAYLDESIHEQVSVIDFEASTSWSYTTVQYSRVLEGTAQWQTETVPLPATASFLLLGFAGLVLRRRLNA